MSAKCLTQKKCQGDNTKRERQQRFASGEKKKSESLSVKKLHAHLKLEPKKWVRFAQMSLSLLPAPHLTQTDSTFHLFLLILKYNSIFQYNSQLIVSNDLAKTTVE